MKAYGKFSAPFNVNNGVQQGCVLAPALFNLFLDHVVRLALQDLDEGVTIQYVVNDKLHIPHQRQDELHHRVQILLYADDMVLVCNSPRR